ncbi:MAG: hypothetical protein IPN66_09185 [Candidatus Competibacteraceae bacterium]|nr:hypothetical protein [Candidatus Competibacteraceae bacterium]
MPKRLIDLLQKWGSSIGIAAKTPEWFALNCRKANFYHGGWFVGSGSSRLLEIVEPAGLFVWHSRPGGYGFVPALQCAEAGVLNGVQARFVIFSLRRFLCSQPNPLTKAATMAATIAARVSFIADHLHSFSPAPACFFPALKVRMVLERQIDAERRFFGSVRQLNA